MMTRATVTMLAALQWIALLCNSCSSTHSDRQSPDRNQSTILPASIKLMEGDVVFRIGEGIMSAAVLAADPQGKYSHCGMVVKADGKQMVVHAVPGEPDYEGDPARVKKETSEMFFSTDKAIAGAVARPKDSSIASKAAQVAVRIYQRNTLFDNLFDSQDPTRMYCTELIVYSFRQSGCDIVGSPSHHFNLPTAKITCWMPSDVYQSGFFNVVAIFP